MIKCKIQRLKVKKKGDIVVFDFWTISTVRKHAGHSIS